MRQRLFAARQWQECCMSDGRIVAHTHTHTDMEREGGGGREISDTYVGTDAKMIREPDNVIRHTQLS